MNTVDRLQLPDQSGWNTTNDQEDTEPRNEHVTSWTSDPGETLSQAKFSECVMTRAEGAPSREMDSTRCY